MKFLLFIALILMCLPVYAQDVQTRQVPRQQVEQKTIDEVVLIINTTNPTKVLVISKLGEWLSDAREVKIHINIGSTEKPQVECTMYKGLFKPDEPEVKTWGLAGIVSADDDTFAQILKDLQKGTFSLGD